MTKYKCEERGITRARMINALNIRLCSTCKIIEKYVMMCKTDAKGPARVTK